MKIAVCVKQVPVSDKVKMDEVTHALIRENSEMDLNPSDACALTEAIHIKEMCGATIDVFTMGADMAKTVLYKCIAMGADEGYLVSDRAFAGGDSLGTAKVLAEAIRLTDTYDLIICGALSSDGATGQVGPMISEILGISSVSSIKKIGDLDGEKFNVYKSWKGQLLHMQVECPALFTVELGSNLPILPTLRNQMKAKKKELHIITNEVLKLDASQIGFDGALSVVTDVMPVKPAGKHSIMLEGSMEEVVKKTIDLIKEASV